jgi:hypothetical protein
VAIGAARNLIETHAHKGRVAHFDDCKEIVSSPGIRCELSTAASGAFLACSSWAGTDGSSLPQLKYGGRNHEKNALDHRPGGSDVIFVGDIPKTRNAKVMRRIVRAAYLGEKLGDTSALENPASLNEIKLAAK